MANIVVYARYSSAGQTEQSIEGQLRVCREYAERNGHAILFEYIDRAVSGTTDNRAQFLQMIHDAEKKQFQYILCYKLDRFSRNKYDSVVYKHKLGQFGVKVISATEAISDTAEGRLVEGLLEMMAEMYSTDLSQKIKRGLRESILKGNYTGGGLLFGYKVVDKKIVINEEQAEIAKDIFKKYADGISKKSIVEELNKKGIKTNRKKPFTISSLHAALKNKKYLGINYVNGVLCENSYPALIDEELFERVQTMLKQHQHAPATEKAKVEYLLTGKVYCGHCGATMVGVCGTGRSKIYNYYCCSNRWKHHSCLKQNILKDKLENYVFNYLKTNVLTPEGIESASSSLYEYFQGNSMANKIKDYEKQLSNIELKLDKCFNLMMEAKSSEMIKRIDDEVRDLSIQKEDLSVELRKFKLADVMKKGKQDFKALLNIFTQGNEDDLEYKKRLVNLFINSIWVFDNKTVIYINTGSNNELTLDDVKQTLESLNSQGSYFMRCGGAQRIKFEPIFIYTNDTLGFVLKNE